MRSTAFFLVRARGEKYARGKTEWAVRAQQPVREKMNALRACARQNLGQYNGRTARFPLHYYQPGPFIKSPSILAQSSLRKTGVGQRGDALHGVLLGAGKGGAAGGNGLALDVHLLGVVVCCVVRREWVSSCVV